MNSLKRDGNWHPFKLLCYRFIRNSLEYRRSVCMLIDHGSLIHKYLITLCDLLSHMTYLIHVTQVTCFFHFQQFRCGFHKMSLERKLQNQWCIKVNNITHTVSYSVGASSFVGGWWYAIFFTSCIKPLYFTNSYGSCKPFSKLFHGSVLVKNSGIVHLSSAE